MPDSISNNKRIAKNTLMLYLRMFLTMAVGLYTSRVVLRTLGVNDYGVYNVVGGFVSMLSYLNTVFVGSTQRFIVYTLGQNDDIKLKKIFKTSITIHFIIAAIILIFAETFGLWFVNNKLVIDPDRMIAANWVYQCSIISLLLTVANVPYKSCVVAHEHMHIYAYASIVEAFAKLSIVFILLIVAGDKLIAYSLLHLLVMLVIPIWYIVYCRRHFEESQFGIGLDKPMLKEMGSYAGWVLFGNLGFTFKDQFSNIIMNHFLGTAINAARGVAAQVNSIVISFADNFTMAMSPQITKQYAAGDIQQSQKLMYAGARYSFFLMGLIAIPLIINIDYVLELWLGEVPEYTSEFLIITLISSMLYSISKTSTIAMQATGNIKWFQIGISIIMLIELPMAWFVLKRNYAPFYALMPVIVTSFISIFFRFFILKKQVPSYSWRYFLINVFAKSSILMILSYIASFNVNKLFNVSFGTFILSSFISVFISGTLILAFGITNNERRMLIGFIRKRFRLL